MNNRIVGWIAYVVVGLMILSCGVYGVNQARQATPAPQYKTPQEAIAAKVAKKNP